MRRRTPAERLALLAAMAEEEDNDLLPRDFGRLVTTETRSMKKQPVAKVTYYQAQILRVMAVTQSPLVKTFDHKYGKITWGLANGREVTDACARALIRNGWVIAQRDGMYDVAQTYVLPPMKKVPQ